MIRHSEFFEWLMKIGTGWIGWTEAQILDTHMVTIELAYEGRLDMLKHIFGGPSEPEEPIEPIGKESILTVLREMNKPPPS